MEPRRLLAPVKTNRTALVASVGLHCAVLAALLVTLNHKNLPPPKITRVAVLSVDTLSRSLSAVPTPAQMERIAPRPRITPVKPKQATGPLSSPVQNRDTDAIARKPLKIDLTKDATIANTEPRVQLFADLMLPDDLLGQEISALRARIWLDEAGQPIRIEWLTEFTSEQQQAQMTEYLMAAFFVPFVENGTSVAGVGLLELQRGGVAGIGSLVHNPNSASPVVTPAVAAGL